VIEYNYSFFVHSLYLFSHSF